MLNVLCKSQEKNVLSFLVTRMSFSGIQNFLLQVLQSQLNRYMFNVKVAILLKQTVFLMGF
jgi:hypothetical protein